MNLGKRHAAEQARRQDVLDSLDKELYTVEEARQHLHIRKEDVYAMIEAGELHAIEVGKKREKRIPKKSLARALAPVDFSDYIEKILREDA